MLYTAIDLPWPESHGTTSPAGMPGEYIIVWILFLYYPPAPLSHVSNSEHTCGYIYVMPIDILKR